MKKAITKGEVKQLLGENGWLRYVITTKKWTKQRAIDWIEQRYQANSKLNDLINKLELTETNNEPL